MSIYVTPHFNGKVMNYDCEREKTKINYVTSLNYKSPKYQKLCMLMCLG